MLRIAHFSPLPPQRSGIATYCAELLPHLAKHMFVDVYADDASGVDDGITRVFAVRPVAEFLGSPRLRERVDACLYHMGNHPLYHERIDTALRSHPGILVLHEFNLHGFYVNRARPDNATAYLREMGYDYGPSGTREARLVLAGLQAAPVEARPLFRRIVDMSPGVIVHTGYARQSILAESPRARVAHIPLAVSWPPPSGPVRSPALFDRFAPAAVVIASFGYIASSKRIDVVLRAIARLRREQFDVHYVLVGEPLPGYDLGSLIAELGLSDHVHQVGFVDDETFQSYLSSIDIGVNLRTGPTGGEMSATLARLMASGKPALVSDVGGFADVPDHCTIKIRQDESEVDQLAAALRTLIEDPNARVSYGEAARQYVGRELSFAGVAQKYADFIQECLVHSVENPFVVKQSGS